MKMAFLETASWRMVLELKEAKDIGYALSERLLRVMKENYPRPDCRESFLQNCGDMINLLKYFNGCTGSWMNAEQVMTEIEIHFNPEARND